MKKQYKYTLAIGAMITILIYLSIRFILPLLGITLRGENQEILSVKEKQWLSELGSLTYIADKNAPPLRFVDETDRQYKGVVVDYVNLLSLELGVDIKLKPMVWEEALINLSEGHSDFADMFRSEERAKHYLFTQPIYNLRAVVAVRWDNLKTDDFSDWTVATQQGDYVNEYLKENYPDMKFKHVDNIGQALDLLVDGQVDAIAGDEPVVFFNIREKGLDSVVKVKERMLYDNEVVFAVPKSKPELVPILNKGIESLQKKQQLELIQQKWFGISTPLVQQPDNKDAIRKFLLAAGILTIAVIGMSTWNYSLKRLVEVKTREVKRSQKELQIMFDGMSEYIVIVDKNSRVVNINSSFLNFLKLSKDQVLNTDCETILHPLGIMEDSPFLKTTLQTSENYEEEVFCKNNVYMVQTCALSDSYGQLRNVMIIIKNITGEKISENQLLQSNKMAAVGQLAAGVAHEIRNPLGIIRTHSFLMRSLFEDGKAIKSLNYIDTAVNRASKIIDNLLDFSRITGDVKEVVDITDIVSEVLQLQNKILIQRNINCVTESDNNSKCYTNSESLRHILVNLVSNAIDAIGEDGTLTIRVSVIDQVAMIAVEDDGAGIPKEQLENIFNPFYTTKEPGKGTGLGLYIVYNEIRKLNGNISVHSVPNERTVFEISLPIEMEGDDR